MEDFTFSELLIVMTLCLGVIAMLTPRPGRAKPKLEKGLPATQSSDPVGQLPPPFNLFLVPTTRENLRASIQKAIPIETARECLTDSQFELLARAIAPAKEFRCWATREAGKGVFLQMTPGDIVLMTQKGTGRFNLRARVLTKLVSEPLGQRIWPGGSLLPWEFIYVLDDLRPLDIKKARLITALRYQPGFWVPGHIRVSPEKLRDAMWTFGTLEGLLDACRS
jgi:hypothetical protein